MMENAIVIERGHFYYGKEITKGSGRETEGKEHF